jgi:hypothetical protein
MTPTVTLKTKTPSSQQTKRMAAMVKSMMVAPVYACLSQRGRPAMAARPARFRQQ